PVEPSRVATTQPLLPNPLHLFEVPRERPVVAGHTIVGVMPAQLLTEASVLLGYGVVAVRSAPPLHPAQTAAKAVLRRLLRHHPSALSGQPPVERHAQQVEAALLLLGLGVLGARTRWREAHQPRLVGMQT